MNFFRFAMWVVESGLAKSVTLTFFKTGHSKFSPDSAFGCLKNNYYRNNVWTYDKFLEGIY